MTTEQLLTERRDSASRKKLPCLVVPAQSVRAWEQREPDTWGERSRPAGCP